MWILDRIIVFLAFAGVAEQGINIGIFLLYFMSIVEFGKRINYYYKADKG